eukprot:CAMPEP_0202913600 /NCGR_PEP_ID=MMETSP1392-20130828/60895_1 /ASSEMBLY_ACC=CAM_ASM_000868 /TAXON_ID=225041 /ORGANISM="Chlamydomonas chlamydogama, Strain SAG 11-48b" /LENGTH=34 /DNA_ID= /DNA_START= /DNA_END= /DNA_ORIENTATION=
MTNASQPCIVMLKNQIMSSTHSAFRYQMARCTAK